MTTKPKYQLFPDLSPEEYAELKEDINQNGVRDPAQTTTFSNGAATPITDLAETAIRALTVQIEHPEQAQPNYVFRPQLRLGGTTTAPPPQR